MMIMMISQLGKHWTVKKPTMPLLYHMYAHIY